MVCTSITVVAFLQLKLLFGNVFHWKLLQYLAFVVNFTHWNLARNGYISRCETFSLDHQCYWDYAVKFARWQHPAVGHGRRMEWCAVNGKILRNDNETRLTGLIDWLIDWLVDWFDLIDWLIWLIDLIDLIDWLIWLIDCGSGCGERSWS